MVYRKLEYTLTFTTPAFLGNAEQQGQWRTPPFKALLRQWWRVVKAKEVGYEQRSLLTAESRLFGAAADDGGGSHRSLVRLRLSMWSSGTYEQLESSGDVRHPEVVHPAIQANLYLGYGPVTTRGLARPPAIAPASKPMGFSVICPMNHLDEIKQSIQLAAWFGTLGSRARNGWGALQISGDDIECVDDLRSQRLEAFTRKLRDCLQLDWPHAIGRDERGPLVWKTGPMNTWRDVMKELARIKIAFRTQPALTLSGVAPGRFAKRHFLAYPVTHHRVNGDGWGNQGRLGNQIRFKVAKSEDRYRGVIVHLPCRLPDEMERSVPALPDQLPVWQAVHTVLDNNAERIQ